MRARTIGYCGWLSVLMSSLGPVACSDEETVVTAKVVAAAETAHTGGDPDDPAIWIHPTTPELSRIVGTDKSQGFFLYDLSGNIVDKLLGTAPDNVDLRHNFTLGGESVALAAAVDRNTDTLYVFAIDEGGHLRQVATDQQIADFGDLYGSCLYRDTGGELYVFVNAKSGTYRQYRILEDDGIIGFALVREFAVSSQPEGCVADDERGWLYLGEEDGGVYRVSAQPKDEPELIAVDRVGDGRLFADVEGMTIYPTTDGGGYLIVSSQGSDEYVVYDRLPPNDYVARFRIGAGKGFDAATDTDGIDVVPLSLGESFPQGMFVAQDDHDDGFTRNFKLVRWEDIATSFLPGLTVDTGVSPRD